MSKTKLLSTISSELQTINEAIDWKIIKGIPYGREARRHRLLVSMLSDIKGSARQGTGFLSFLL